MGTMMSNQEELVPEIGGSESFGSGDAKSPRRLTNQGGDSIDDDVDPCTGASTASRIDEAAAEFNETEMEVAEFERDNHREIVGEAVSGLLLGERMNSSVGRECLPLDDGTSASGDFVTDSCGSTGGGASFELAVSPETIGDNIIAKRERKDTTFDLSVGEGETPVEGRDLVADKARAEVDQRTVDFFNAQKEMAKVPISDGLSKKVVDDARGCAPREDNGTTSDDSSRKPRSSIGDAGRVCSVKEESSDIIAGEPKDKNEERTEIEIDDFEEEAAKIFSTRDAPIKPVISVTQGEGSHKNNSKMIDMGDSQDMKIVEFSADLTQQDMGDSKIRLFDHETPSGSNGITRSSSCLEPETAEQEDLSDDCGVGVFEFLSKRRRKKRRKNVDAAKSLSISIPSLTPQEAASTDTKTIDSGNEKNVVEGKIWPIDDNILDEEDPNLFYSTTNEGDDPQYVEFRLSMIKNRLQAQLVKIQKDKKEDMKKIQAYLYFMWEESNGALQGEIKKVRDEIEAKQTRQRNQLTDKHKGQSEADEQKLNEGETWLVQKQHLETQQSMSQHAGMLGWNEIAAQLQNRHAFQRHQFEERKVEMKKRLEQEINTQNQILEAHHKKRNAESQLFIKELTEKCHKQHDDLKTKLLRLHEDRFEQKRKEAEASFGGSQSDTLAQGITNSNLNYSCAEQSNDQRQTKEEEIEGVVSHDAAMRQKQRKSLMNNASIQLAIEIHNEGIIAITRSNQSPESEDSKPPVDRAQGPVQRGLVSGSDCSRECTGDKRSSIFIPWGRSSTALLYSIVLGEIPSDCLMDQICLGGRGTLNGGLVKCMITDTRTSEDTAVSERANIFAQVQQAKGRARVEDLERRYNAAQAAMLTLQGECTDLVDEVDKTSTEYQNAAVELEQAKQAFDMFKAQAQHFFNQDGTLSPRVAMPNQHKLLTAMQKYKNNYESAKSKVAEARQPVEVSTNALKLKKSRIENVQKEFLLLEESLKTRHALASGKRKNDDKSLETTVENISAAISKIAEKRRTQVNRNTTNSGASDSWEKSMTSIPEEMRKTFHQKMLRRRITTMLRPTTETMLADIKRAHSLKNPSQISKGCFDIVCDNDESLSSELRIEQLLLLALHPPSPKDPLPPVPDQSSPNRSWAEPGWQLIIDNPEDSEKKKPGCSFFPLQTEGHLSQKFLSICCSSGRQAAALIKPRHLRMLTDPLSFTCQASAPAETNPLAKKKTSKVNADPLSTTEDKMRVGYSFIIRPAFEKQGEGGSSVVDDRKEDGAGKHYMIVEKVKKPRKASSKVKTVLAKAVRKKKKIQAQEQPHKQPDAASSVIDAGFHAQGNQTAHQILQSSADSTSNQNQPISRVFHQPQQQPQPPQEQEQEQQQQQQQQQLLLLQHQQQQQLQFQQLQQQQQIQQQQQHHMAQSMRHLQMQLQHQQPNPTQMQPMHMPAQSPRDQLMQFPLHFGQQMNPMLQQNKMGGMSMQPQQQSGCNSTSTNSQLPSKKK